MFVAAKNDGFKPTTERVKRKLDGGNHVGAGFAAESEGLGVCCVFMFLMCPISFLIASRKINPTKKN